MADSKHDLPNHDAHHSPPPEPEDPSSSVAVEVGSSPDVSIIQDEELPPEPTHHSAAIRYRGRNFIGCCETRRGLIIMTIIDAIVGSMTLLLYIALASNIFPHKKTDEVYTSLSLARSCLHMITVSLLLYGIFQNKKWICIICQSLEWIWTISGVVVLFLDQKSSIHVGYKAAFSVCVLLFEIYCTVIVVSFVKQISFYQNAARTHPAPTEGMSKSGSLTRQ